MIYDDHHLLRVITHCSAWILISSLRGPSAGAHRAFKGWLECSTHLSTLHSSQECRGRMSRPGLEDIRFRMHDWMTKGRALFFSLFLLDFLFLVTYLFFWDACSVWSKTKCTLRRGKLCEATDRINLISYNKSAFHIHDGQVKKVSRYLFRWTTGKVQGFNGEKKKLVRLVLSALDSAHLILTVLTYIVSRTAQGFPCLLAVIWKSDFFFFLSFTVKIFSATSYPVLCR